MTLPFNNNATCCTREAMANIHLYRDFQSHFRTYTSYTPFHYKYLPPRIQFHHILSNRMSYVNATLRHTTNTHPAPHSTPSLFVPPVYHMRRGRCLIAYTLSLLASPFSTNFSTSRNLSCQINVVRT